MIPKISIIIPVYNAAPYIERCVHSILSQDFRNWELILVDDGSKDNSKAICDHIANCHDNIKVIHKPNGGVSSARNIGLDNASGEWIVFVDADDQVTRDALKQYEMAVETYPDADYHTFDIHTIGLDGVISSFGYNDYILKPSELISKMLKYEVCVGPFAKLFRKSVIDRFGLRFNPNLRIGEDLVFNLDYIINAKATCAMHSGVVYEYLQNENSAMFARDNTTDYDRLNNVLQNYKGTDGVNDADINFCIATNILNNLIRKKKYIDKALSDKILCHLPITDNGNFVNRYIRLLQIGRWMANARLYLYYNKLVLKHWI